MYSSKYEKRPGQNKDFQGRILFFIISIIFSFFLLIVMIANIQIVKNLSYSKKSKKNREKVVRTQPIRGNIYSSDGKLLAQNMTSFNLFINPRELYKDQQLRQEQILYISDVIDVEYSEIETILANNKRNEDVLIKENMSFIDFLKIKENLNNMPGVSVKESLYRVYPNKDVLSHVLGYTGPIDQDELAVRQESGYHRRDFIGKNGIEKYYEDLLRGKEGRRVYSIDARMAIQNEIVTKAIKPEPGNELILTIDLEFQKTVEDILADRTGVIIVEKPSTGEILAMASYPDFDPNIYILQTKENYEKKREISLNTRNTPLINRNIQSLYPPASVFKLVTTTAILNENIIPMDTKYFCAGQFNLNQKFGCWVYPSQHGWQNLNEAVMNSCDIYFYNAGLKVGPDRIYQYALSYGFGSALGIDLPYEKVGIVPSVQWMKSRGEVWQHGHTLNTVIGQGDVKVTPLQAANFMSVICNAGYSFKPHILKEIRSSSDGSLIKRNEPEKIIYLENYEPWIFNKMKGYLRDVVTKGTAAQAFANNALRIAGKTGTAEIGLEEKKQTHSWFAGFGPIDYPKEEQVVVVVLIEYENSEYLRYAAPIASMVFNSWFRKENFYESAKRLWYPVRATYND